MKKNFHLKQETEKIKFSQVFNKLKNHINLAEKTYELTKFVFSNQYKLLAHSVY